jgi:hypothetical protein
MPVHYMYPQTEQRENWTMANYVTTNKYTYGRTSGFSTMGFIAN